MNKTINDFENVPVHKLVLKNIIPSILAMLMVLIYNLADTFFIGQTHNDLMVASVSITTPVFLVFSALGNLFGTGGTSLISRKIGEKQMEYVKHVSSFCMYMCLVLGIILSIILIVFINPVLNLIGTSGETMAYTKNYLLIVSLSGPFVLISNCFSNILRAEGQSNKATVGMMIGNILNIILDPIFILILHLDVSGAAIATVIGNICATLYFILYFIKGKSILSIKISDFAWKNDILKEVVGIGTPASLGQFLMSVSQIVLNNMMVQYGNMAVAGIGVATKIMMIIMLLGIGLGQGVQPLLGYCIGARVEKRFKEIMRVSVIFAIIMEIVLVGITYLNLNSIVNIFLANDQAFVYAVHFTKILLITGLLFGVFYVFVNSIQAMGDAKGAFVVNICRQGLIYIPLLFILNQVQGIDGLIYAQTFADIGSFLLACILYVKSKKKYLYNH